MTSMGALAARTLDLIFAHPEKAQKSSQPSILKSYLSVPDSDTEDMDPYQVWRECFNLAFAGPGSTTAALTTIFFELGSPHSRKWQERIRADLSAEAAPADTSAVILAVIKETMRLHSPFPTVFPRVIAAGTETAIPDLAAPLPVVLLVAANIYVLRRSKEIWGDDADMWKPERWLGDEKGIKRLEDKFVVFSKWPSGCGGKEIAMLMMEKTVIGVLEKCP
jgi:benzoate 4-monooxygenase